MISDLHLSKLLKTFLGESRNIELTEKRATRYKKRGLTTAACAKKKPNCVCETESVRASESRSYHEMRHKATPKYDEI